MINKYNKLIEQIVNKWAKRYIKELYDEELDERDLRIMDYKGVKGLGVIEINDEYHNLDDILISEKYNIPSNVQQDYYNLCLDTELKPGIKLYNYYIKIKSKELGLEKIVNKTCN